MSGRRGPCGESAGMLALGTDFPVVDINPFASLHSAVTRKDEYGVATGHNPWETLTLPEALCGYTQDAARAYRAEKEMGDAGGRKTGESAGAGSESV